MNTIKQLWIGAEGTMWRDLYTEEKIIFLCTAAFCIGFPFVMAVAS